MMEKVEWIRRFVEWAVSHTVWDVAAARELAEESFETKAHRDPEETASICKMECGA